MQRNELSKMHCSELLKPDLLGEVILVGSGFIIFVPLLILLVIAGAQVFAPIQ
jgi:hypothetical protein